MLCLIRAKAAELKSPPPAKSEVLAAYNNLIKTKKIKLQPALRQFLVKRAVRTLSGVTVITVLTKPFGCPGRCVYCPTEICMPKSYLSNEPAAQRALVNKFNPIEMVQGRIAALEANGHSVDKIELIVLGGTWSTYSKKYQDWFIASCFLAANTYGQNKIRPMKSLMEEQKINETAKYKIIGLTLETRPDYINETEIKNLRRLGATRVQLGIQHTDNNILKKIKRGHTLQDSITATRLLKETGFKVDHHYMPDLPGSTPKKDLKMFKYVFDKPDLAPDQIKIYPTLVNKSSELYKWYKQGKYKPYSHKQLVKLLLEVKKIIPPYVRINRLVRDIPKQSITAGNKVTNLRQYLQQIAKQQGWSCQCIHCREVRGTAETTDKIELVKRTYRASAGAEYFISFESPNRKKLYAFLRLRLNDEPQKNIFKELRGAALVRELHVYGQMLPVYKTNLVTTKTQHLGLGTQLMALAETIAKQNGFKKLAVISGIGVREYYKKLGYQLEGTYMVKKI